MPPPFLYGMEDTDMNFYKNLDTDVIFGAEGYVEDRIKKNPKKYEPVEVEVEIEEPIKDPIKDDDKPADPTDESDKSEDVQKVEEPKEDAIVRKPIQTPKKK